MYNRVSSIYACPYCGEDIADNLEIREDNQGEYVKCLTCGNDYDI